MGDKPANDPRTGRPWGDHGTASLAIDYALDHEEGDAGDFLRAWREGGLEEWPEFYAWLQKVEAREGGLVV